MDTGPKPPEKRTEWETMESCLTFPPYGGEMEGNHYDYGLLTKRATNCLDRDVREMDNGKQCITN
jgi:hypothetical protein